METTLTESLWKSREIFPLPSFGFKAPLRGTQRMATDCEDTQNYRQRGCQEDFKSNFFPKGDQLGTKLFLRCASSLYLSNSRDGS